MVFEQLPGVPADSQPVALLGGVPFRVVGPLVGLQSRRAYEYAEHARVSGKPTLQRVGESLESLTLELELSYVICDPDAAYREIQTLAEAGQAVPLVWASGVVRGMYVITNVEETTRALTPQGVTLQRSARVELLEWVAPPPVVDAPPRAESAPARGTSHPSARTRRPNRPSAGGGATHRDVPPSTITRRR